MYEMVILCFLTRAPMHGYLIAKIINDMIGPYARLSNGRLYPLLSKLEAEGLIVAVDSGAETRADRRHRAYEITDTGRKRFHQLMMDTTSNPGDYQRIFWYKLPFLEYLNPVERLFLLDHFINFCQTHLFHVRNEMEDLVRQTAANPLMQKVMTPARLDATIRAMRHLENLWELERENAQSWRAREVASQEKNAILPGGSSPEERTAVGT